MSLPLISSQIKSSLNVVQDLLGDDLILEQIARLATSCCHSLSLGGKIIFAGNGGSFADALHLSAELVGRFRIDREPIASIVLGVNSSTLTAIANDFAYEYVFARELSCLGASGDIFIPISTSGNSPNILHAVETAISLDIHTIGLTGQSGGEISNFCDCIRVPSSCTARIQECHTLIGHILCELIELKMFSR